MPNETQKPQAKPAVAVKAKEKSFGKKLKEAMFGKDIGSVSSHVFYNILIPAFKKLLSDMTNGAVNMALYGDNKRPGSSGKSFTSMYSERGTVASSGSTSLSYDGRRRVQSRVNDIFFDSREEAIVAANMIYAEFYEHGYDYVTVLKLRSMFGLSTEYTDNSWGWKKTDLPQNPRDPIFTQDGVYILDLPPVRPI